MIKNLSGDYDNIKKTNKKHNVKKNNTKMEVEQ